MLPRWGWTNELHPIECRPITEDAYSSQSSNVTASFGANGHLWEAIIALCYIAVAVLPNFCSGCLHQPTHLSGHITLDTCTSVHPADKPTTCLQSPSPLPTERLYLHVHLWVLRHLVSSGILANCWFLSGFYSVNHSCTRKVVLTNHRLKDWLVSMVQLAPAGRCHLYTNLWAIQK